MKFFRRRLSNGAPLIGEKREETNAVAVGFLVPYGSGSDPLGKSGLAHLYEHDSFRGGPHSARIRNAHRVEYKGGVINAGTNNCATYFYCKAPKSSLSEAVELLRGIILRPTLNEEMFNTERGVVMAEIGEYHDSPKGHLDDLSVLASFRPPFNRPILGTQESLKTISMHDLFKLRSASYNPSQCCFGIVGNFDEIKAYHLFKERLDVFPKTKNGILKRNPIIPQCATIVEEREDILQAHLRFSIHGPSTRSHRRFALYVLDDFISAPVEDGFLFDALRNQEGVVYSATGEINYFDKCTLFSIGTSTDPKNLKKVIDLIKMGFKSAETMHWKKFNKIKERIIGTHEIEEDSSEERLIALMQNESEHRRGAESYYRVTDYLKRVSLEEVRNLAHLKRYSLASMVPKGSISLKPWI